MAERIKRSAWAANARVVHLTFSPIGLYFVAFPVRSRGRETVNVIIIIVSSDSYIYFIIYIYIYFMSGGVMHYSRSVVLIILLL